MQYFNWEMQFIKSCKCNHRKVPFLNISMGFMVLRGGGPSHEDNIKYEKLKSQPSPAESFKHTIPVSFDFPYCWYVCPLPCFPHNYFNCPSNVLAFELINKFLFWGELFIIHLSHFSLPAVVRGFPCLCLVSVFSDYCFLIHKVTFVSSWKVIGVFEPSAEDSENLPG